MPQTSPSDTYARLESVPLTQTGWAIGFWWSELSHPYWEFATHGYVVTIASPNGGRLHGDAWSDPRDASGYSSEDLLSLGFTCSLRHMSLLEETPALGDLDLDAYDAVLLVRGQAPMYTFFNDDRVHEFVRDVYEAGKVTAVICHATCVLLKTRLVDGRLLVEGKTWTGFANSAEDEAGHALVHQIPRRQGLIRGNREAISLEPCTARATRHMPPPTD